MPLPDERPRQSVANLIGRFEQQQKRQSITSPPISLSRSTSVVSHITGDSAKEEAKEKREWPPRPSTAVDQTSAATVVPSWSRTLSASQSSYLPSTAKSSPSLEPPVPASQSAPTLTDVIAPVAEAQPSPADPAPAPAAPSVKPAPHSLGKSTTTKPTTAPTSFRTPTKATAKSTPKPSVSAPLKPQLTGQSTLSIPSSARKPAIPKSTPNTPSRPKTPSRASLSTTRPKTPSSAARPKTPSTGLFAPTAASLAKSRNAPPQAPTPVRKATLSSAAADRLSKPTAASLSKARAAPTTPAVRGKPAAARGGAVARGGVKAKTAPSSRRPKKEEHSVEREQEAHSDAGAELAQSSQSFPVIPPHIEGNGFEPSVSSDGGEEDHGEVEEHESAEASYQEDQESVEVEEKESGAVTKDVEEVEAEALSAPPRTPTPTSPEHELPTTVIDAPLTSVAVTVSEPSPVTEGSEEANPVNDDIEDIVNLLESGMPPRIRPASVSSIPDEVIDIPDEDESK